MGWGAREEGWHRERGVKSWFVRGTTYAKTFDLRPHQSHLFEGVMRKKYGIAATLSTPSKRSIKTFAFFWPPTLSLALCSVLSCCATHFLSFYEWELWRGELYIYWICEQSVHTSFKLKPFLVLILSGSDRPTFSEVEGFVNRVCRVCIACNFHDSFSHDHSCLASGKWLYHAQ